MGVLEDYEKRAGLEPLTADEIVAHIEVCDAILAGSESGVSDKVRVTAWLSERVLTMSAALGDPTGTMACGWCWRAAGLTQEIWRGLPKYNLADAQAHALVCEHNPLVAKIRELEAKVSDLEHDVWCDSLGETT